MIQILPPQRARHINGDTDSRNAQHNGAPKTMQVGEIGGLVELPSIYPLLKCSHATGALLTTP